MAETEPVNPQGFLLFDDQEREAGRNGRPALAEQIRKAVDALNAIQNSGRMLGTSWGRDGTQVNNDNLFRTLWNHHHAPGRKFQGVALTLKTAGTRVSGQGVRLTLSATATDYVQDYQISTTTTSPMGVEEFPFGGDLDHASAASRISCNVGSISANGPGIVSLMLYERAQTAADPSVANWYVPKESVRPGADIIGTALGTYNTVDSLRSAFLHAWNRKRPTFIWSANTPGTSYINFNTVSTSFRYIFDQTIGNGGTAPTSTGPAFTIPAYKAGSGLNTSVSCAVYIYAAMSGATDTGSIAISNSDGAGGMTSPATLYSPAAVSGVTYAWYPATGATPATFRLRTDIPFDRIVLCGKSSGSTDNLRIAAFAIFPMHSQTIT